MLGVLLVASLITTAGEADAAAPAALDGCVAAPIGEDGWDPVAGGAAGGDPAEGIALPHRRCGRGVQMGHRE